MGDKLSLNQIICFIFIYLNEHLLHCLLPCGTSVISFLLPLTVFT